MYMRRWAGQVVGPAGQPILGRTLHPSLLGVGSIPTISTQFYPPSVHVCDFPLGLKPWSNTHTHTQKPCVCLSEPRFGRANAGAQTQHTHTQKTCVCLSEPRF